MRQAVIACFAMVALTQPCSPQSQTPDAFRISVEVDLVELQATVRDRQGRFVPDLHQADFQIREEGVLQEIRVFGNEDVPVTVGLVVDHSGSMKPKMSHVEEAALSFARSSNPRDQMFVVNFNEKVTLGLPASKPFTDVPQELENAIAQAESAGMTALYDAVSVALDRLRSSDQKRKVLIVISDGGDNASTLHLAELLKKAEASTAAIYTIGIFEDADPDKNPEVLRRLARATGGEAFFPHQLDEVATICESIAKEIRHQYTLGYVSSNTPKPGVFRGVRVSASTARQGKLAVRTRAGYLE